MVSHRRELKQVLVWPEALAPEFLVHTGLAVTSDRDPCAGRHLLIGQPTASRLHPRRILDPRRLFLLGGTLISLLLTTAGSATLIT
jgi:hypothetical protein